jgi:hypothetical protein
LENPHSLGRAKELCAAVSGYIQLLFSMIQEMVPRRAQLWAQEIKSFF